MALKIKKMSLVFMCSLILSMSIGHSYAKAAFTLPFSGPLSIGAAEVIATVLGLVGIGVAVDNYDEFNRSMDMVGNKFNTWISNSYDDLTDKISTGADVAIDWVQTFDEAITSGVIGISDKLWDGLTNFGDYLHTTIRNPIVAELNGYADLARYLDFTNYTGINTYLGPVYDKYISNTERFRILSYFDGIQYNVQLLDYNPGGLKSGLTFRYEFYTSASGEERFKYKLIVDEYVGGSLEAILGESYNTGYGCSYTDLNGFTALRNVSKIVGDLSKEFFDSFKFWGGVNYEEWDFEADIPTSVAIPSPAVGTKNPAIPGIDDKDITTVAGVNEALDKQGSLADNLDVVGVKNPTGVLEKDGPGYALPKEREVSVVTGNVWERVISGQMSLDDAMSVENINAYVVDASNVIVNDSTYTDSDPSNDKQAPISSEPNLGENAVYMTEGLRTLFPFCIPFDLIKSFKLLSANPVVPHWEIPFVVPGLVDYTFVIDLAQFEGIARILRTTETIGFIVSLILITRNVIKG